MVKVAIIGDSYTSGEGNNPATYTTNANGDIYPQHQSNMSPAMQALQQIVNANPGIDFQITNVAVSGATRAAALSPSEPGTAFLQPAQIDTVQNADLVINGFGGNDAGFPQWARTLLSPGTSDSSIPALWYGNPANPSAPNFSQYFTSGANYNDQLNLLSAIEPSLKPGAVVITNGYPQVFGDTPPAWDPSSPWTTSLGQNAVTYSNLFAQSLNKDNSAASAVAGYQNPMITNYFGDLQSALDGGQIGSATPMVNYIVPTWTGIDQSSLHPNPLGQTAAGSALQPVVNQAVQDIGASNGFTVNPGQPVMDTFAYEWNNRVSVPLQVQANQDYQQQVQPIAGQLQQTQGLLQLAQQAQQGPQFTDLGVPANQWTALSTLYPQPVNLPDGWTAPAPSTPTAFPAPPADSGTPAAPGAATGPGSTSGPGNPGGPGGTGGPGSTTGGTADPAAVPGYGVPNYGANPMGQVTIPPADIQSEQPNAAPPAAPQPDGVPPLTDPSAPPTSVGAAGQQSPALAAADQSSPTVVAAADQSSPTVVAAADPSGGGTPGPVSDPAPASTGGGGAVYAGGYSGGSATG